MTGAAFHHISVMRDAAVAALNVQGTGVYIDATFGGGGYTRKILDVPRARVIAFDRDTAALQNGQTLAHEFGARLQLVHAPFSALQSELRALGIHQVDGIVFDLGVSSPQLDEASRGFSFRLAGPLDMRMDQTSGRTAADIVNSDDEETLATILYTYGDERKSRAIARAIVLRRAEKPFLTTDDLAALVRQVVRVSPKDPSDPATRTFQALRIAVNDELGELKTALEAALEMLAVGGRIVVVSFHSLEDRIVKHFFAQKAGKAGAVSRYQPDVARVQPVLKIITSAPQSADETEIAHNPRARSAKMRVAEKVRS